MASEPIRVQEPVRFGEDFELDVPGRRLCRRGHTVKIERIPLEILVQLVEHRGEIVTRDEIVTNVWGKGVFLDTDNSIRGAIRKIRQVLKDDPEDPQFIQTVTGQGYRFIAPVVSPGEESRISGSDEAEKELKTPPVGAPKIPHPHRWGVVLIGLLIVLVLVAGIFYRWKKHYLPEAKIESIAVLPLDNLSGDPSQEYFVDGMTDALITDLAKVGSLRVISRTSMMQYKGLRKPLPQIARELNVDAVVEGSVVRSGNHVRITAQLINAYSDQHLWAESYERDLSDILRLQSEIAQAIVQRVRVQLTPQQQMRLGAALAVDPEAYEAYLKGRYYWNQRTADSLQKASAYFQQAIDKDPAYAAAYSGLADCNSGLTWHGFRSPDEALPKAYAAALKSIEIDPQSAEAHASLGLVLHHRWDWPRAEAEFRRAIDLDPQYANAHHWYGDYLSVRGRHDEALLEAKEALRLDPLNRMIGTWVALRYYLARNYNAAIEQSRNTVDLDSNFAAAHLLLGENYVQTGLYKEGLAELERAAKLSGNSPIYLAQVAVAHAAVGRKPEALRIVAQLQKISSECYVSPYGLAQVYAALNDKEQTFKWLQAALDDRAVWMSYLAVDPVFDNLRSDQRFQDLLRQVGMQP
ncbi:MAG TPA: winged helix-turn-helix domain-containing protein [Terriglobales bacterium]|nr:winged helix-turn-helix domain-containing protein [Terriglobales bacterium]